MVNSALNRYDPKDRKSHGILKFFSEDLSENEVIEFVESIFNHGSWILATEISKSSESKKVKLITENIFFQTFNDWITKRIEYSLSLAPYVKKPYLPINLKLELREALLSIRNLNFPKEIMTVLERFLDQSNPQLLKKYLDDSFWLVIEEFDVKEIEIFFSYFSALYIKNNSLNIGNFIYHFLNVFAYSHKIFSLSKNFNEQLDLLSKALQKNNFKNNYSLVVSILQLELIKNKTLDLSNSKFDDLIDETISTLEKGSHNNLIFFKFLKRFAYPFKNYNADNEIGILLENIDKNVQYVSKLDDFEKRSALQHYVKNSEQYFELLLFYLEHFDNEQIEHNFVAFIKLVDKLRNSFSTILWFDEYLNLDLINGRIDSIVRNGLSIKIDENYFNQKIKEKNQESLCTRDFVLRNRFAFMHIHSLKQFPKTRKLYYSLRKETLKNKTLIVDDTNIEELESFLISNVNFSNTNKGRTITLMPLNKKLFSTICEYKLKSFFSSVEIFLIEKACKYLDTESPFQKKTALINNIFPNNFINDYKINFSEKIFWDILKNLRPALYEKMYLIHKRNEESIKKLVNAFERDEIITGYVKSRTKGGLVVDVFGIEAFLPGSQIDVKPIRDYDIYVDKTMEFKVVKINHEYKNVVVSHKALIEDEIEHQRAEIISKLEKGQVLEGIVKNITSYGVFIDVGGIDGLIHITDLSWGRINHPEEVVELDQKMKVVILDFDDNKKRIALGLKQLSPHPWDSLSADLKVGDKVKGKVVVIVDYGVFIEIAPGVEGLIHVSEISWSQHLFSAKDFLKVDDDVEAVILTLDRKKRRMSLGMKQLIPDPWTNIRDRYPVNSKHTPIVRNFTKFGIFVEIEEGVDGLIHISNLSWSKKIKHPAEFTKIGEEIEVIILDIDEENRRLSLGHKQLEENPWDVFEAVFTVGSVHSGIVTKYLGKKKKPGLISLAKDAKGTCPCEYMNKENGNYAAIGETLDFVVLEFNKGHRSIILSHSGTYDNKVVTISDKDKTNRKRPKISYADKYSDNSIEIDVKMTNRLKDEGIP